MPKRGHHRRKMEAEQREVFLGNISGGRAGVRQTLNFMSHIVREWKRSPEIRSKTIQIVSKLPGKDWVAECDRVFQWVRDNIRYTMDIQDIETLQTPDVTLADSAGDCDDMAILICCMLESIGHKTRFKAIGIDGKGYLEHVYAQTLIGTIWVSLDSTEPYPMGWEPPNITEWMYGNH